MHRLKVSLLCLLTLSLAGSVFGQTAPQPDSGGVATYDSYSGGATMGSGTYFNIRYMSGNGVGYQQGYTQIGSTVPFWMGDNSLIAPDVRLMLGNNSTVGGNFGLIGRTYSDSIDRIFGAAAYLDVDQSSNRNTYTQGTFGLETLGQYWDLRGNYYYVPGTQDKFVGNGAPLCVSGDPFFSGNNIVFQGQQGLYREQAMSGFDLEFGMPVFQSTPWLRAYAGTYYYKANQVAPPMSVNIPNQTDSNPWGFRGRLDAWIADDLLVGVNVTTDSVWGTNVNGMVDFRFSGFKPTRYFPQWTTRERMLAPWQRNWRIAVEQYQTAQNTDVVAINPNTGKPYFITFVNADNPNAGPGTGTYEDPFKSFNHPNGIAGTDIIYVARDSSSAANPYIGTMKLFDNQILLGEGGTMTPLALTASYGQCSVNGNFTLPGMDGSGNYPWVSAPGGHAIGLANNNEVSGFHIINSVDGIVGTNINNANLRDLDIHGNSGRGINLTNVGGNVSLLNVNSSSNGTGIFMSETNKALVASFLDVTASNNVGRGVDVVGTGGSVTLNANDPTQPLVASGNGGTNFNVGMTGGTFLGNFTGSTFNSSTGGSGFGYSQAGGSGTLNLTNVKANSNGIDGLTLTASAAAAMNVNVTDSQLNSNTRDGIHTDATGGSSVTTVVDPTSMNSNGRDGYFYNLAGNSILNATFDSDTLNSNGRSAFFGLMNNSTATFNITNTLATNSRQNSFALDATNGSFFTGTIANTNFSNSQLANGMNVTLHSGSTASFGMTSVTDNNNSQNGVSFLADNSTFSMTSLSSTFNSNAMNGIIGTAQNGSSATLDMSNGSISNNAQNGVFVTTTGLSGITASFNNEAINSNTTGNGVHLAMDNSPNSTLSMTGTTTLNNNGVNGLLIDATTNTVFTPTLDGTTIQGNGQDGIHINVASASTVGSAGTPGTFTDVTSTGNTGNGIEVDVTGANSTSTLQLTNFNGSANTQSNAAVNVSLGGFLNFMTADSNFSGSTAGAGVDALVTDVNSTAYIDLDTATINGNAASGISAVVMAPAPGVGQNGASLNVCLDGSDVSYNTLQGISIAASGAGATASFGVGQLNQNDGSTVTNNGLEGVLGNAANGGTINFREIDSHFDSNGQTAASDGINFGADNGTIRTLFYGGSADGNSRNGLRVGPIEPAASTNNSNLTISLANGFSASNNANYGLYFDATGANSANLLQDPGTPPPVFTGNGTGAQFVNFAGANQVVLQEIGSFSNQPGDGVFLNFSNINTAIVSFNGLGNGTISNNGGDGIDVVMTNVKNGSVLVTGYTDISNNAGDGIHIVMDASGLAAPMNAAIEIDGVAGKTNMDSNGANAVNIVTNNATMVNNFASLPGVSLTILTPTNNDSFNACIPVPVSQSGGLAGVTPTTALSINNLNVTNSTQQGIVFAGTNTTIQANGGSISNNTVSGSLGGDGINVSLNETVAQTTPIATGFTFDSNTVTGNSNNGITFGVTNTAVSTVTSANNLTFTNNTVSTNGGNGIDLSFTNPAGSTATVNNISFTGDTIDGNTGNGIAMATTGINTATTLSNETITNNTANGLLATLTGTGTANQTSGAFTLSGSTITGNGLSGANFVVDNAAHLDATVNAGTLIDSNGIDGMRITATDANTTVTGDITGSTLTNNGTSGAGNGLTGNFDSGATGAFTIDTSTFGNTALLGGTQINGLELNVNQNAVDTATNVTATITNTTFSNNEVSGIAGNITGNNAGLNPTTGAEITLTNVTVSGNGNDGLAFNVDNAALLQMSVDASTVTGNGHNGMFINANDVDTLVALDMSDSAFNNNGTNVFSGDGFNATIDTGATLNVCAETTGAGVPMSFSGNTGDGFDVLVNGVGSRSDIDFHSVIVGASAADGLTGNIFNGVSTQSFDGAELNFRSYTSHFDGNGQAGLLGLANNTAGGPVTTARYRIIGGSADGNTGDGFLFNAISGLGTPPHGTVLTAQFQADDLGNGISAQNNAGYGLEYLTNTPGGGIDANLLMTGGSQLLNNGAGTLNVNMAGADQAIIGLSGTFDGSTTGDGIHIDLQNITGLALVSLQGPGEVSGNAGDGIDISMTNVAQGGVFIGGFTNVSNNGTANSTALGQDGIKVTMDSVSLGAVSINGQTASLPSNIMDVSNNTGNGVNVIAQNGSVIDNASFNAVLGAQLVSIIDYTPPDAPCPTPLPNPLLTTTPTNVTTALGINFPTDLTIQNLNIDNNGNATAGNLTGSGIAVTVDGSTVVSGLDINNNVISNTGAGVAANTHNGVTLNFLNSANLPAVNLIENDINGNKGDGFAMLNPFLTANPLAMNFTRNSITSNALNGVEVGMPNLAFTTPTLDMIFTNDSILSNGSNGVLIALANNPNSQANANVSFLSDSGTANPFSGKNANDISNNTGMGVYINALNIIDTPPASADRANVTLTIGGTGDVNTFNANGDAGVGINLNGASTGTATVSNASFSNNVARGLAGSHFSGDGFAIFLNNSATFSNSTFGDNTLNNTTFSNNAANGFRLDTSLSGKVSTMNIQHATVTGNGNDGIHFVRNAGVPVPGPYVSNVTIQNNTITQNANGISLSAQFADLADTYAVNNNTITNNRQNGVNLFTVADADLTVNFDTNTISSNGFDGIHAAQNLGNTDLSVITSTIIGNTINNNGDGGIDYNASHSLIIGTVAAPNTINGNNGDGIAITGTSEQQIGGFPNQFVDQIIGNSIQNNGGNGINITVAGQGLVLPQGAFTLVNIDGNNHFSPVPGGGFGGINGNGQDGIRLTDIGGKLQATVNNNDVLNSGGDGVQLLTSNLGQQNDVIITNNDIDTSGARGINVLNASNSETNLQIDGNIVARSFLEGVYIVNTSTGGQLGASSANVQGVDALANATMAIDNTWLNDPELALTMHTNTITSNGQAANSGILYNASGLVVRVGSSGATQGAGQFTDNGGFASTYTSATLTDATVVTVANITRGGVVANVFNNAFTGQFNADATFQAFTSTTPPPTTTGQWTDQNEGDSTANPPVPRNPANDIFQVTSYTTDPLARLDLRFTATNTGESAIVTRTDFFSGGNGVYNNAEGLFKSRTKSNDGNDPIVGGGNAANQNVRDDGGPFDSATRDRNITRQASNASPWDTPSGVTSDNTVNGPLNQINVSVNGFLYPGVGDSTFRRTGDSSTAGFNTIPAGSGFGNAVGDPQNQVGALSFQWGSF